MKTYEIQKDFRKRSKNVAQNVEPFKYFDDLHRRNSAFSRFANNHK